MAQKNEMEPTTNQIQGASDCLLTAFAIISAAIDSTSTKNVLRIFIGNADSQKFVSRWLAKKANKADAAKLAEMETGQDRSSVVVQRK